MLPKSNRLNLKKDFKWVASGRKTELPSLKLFLREGSNSTPRIGIATSSKVFKEAVDRNRSRRLISKGFENLIETLPSSINIVALPKAGILDKSSDEITKELQTLKL
jgi:ribonuclease P protein component